MLDAVAPFTEKTGTAAAFVSADGGRDIQLGLIDYVANFSTVAAGEGRLREAFGQAYVDYCSRVRRWL